MELVRERPRGPPRKARACATSYSRRRAGVGCRSTRRRRRDAGRLVVPLAALRVTESMATVVGELGSARDRSRAPTCARSTISTPTTFGDAPLMTCPVRASGSRQSIAEGLRHMGSTDSRDVSRPRQSAFILTHFLRPRHRGVSLWVERGSTSRIRAASELARRAARRGQRRLYRRPAATRARDECSRRAHDIRIR